MEKQEIVFGSGKVLYYLDKQRKLKKIGSLESSHGSFIFMVSSEYSGKLLETVQELKPLLRNMHFISPEDFLAGLKVVLEKWQEGKRKKMEKSYQRCFPESWQGILGNTKAFEEGRGGADAIVRLLPEMVNWLDCFIVTG
jgi:hypothetical protein